jgi:N-acetyltransferase
MKIDLQPTLENELILLRPLIAQDFEPLYQVAKDPLVWEQHPNNDRYKKEVFDAFFRDAVESGGALTVVAKENKQIIGSSRFKKLSGVDTALEIGWSFLARAYWGGRYNRSMKKLMLEHAFTFVDEVVFYIGKDNMRSQKAVEKIGGIKLTDSTHEKIMTKEKDKVTYCIRKAQWYENN